VGGALKRGPSGAARTQHLTPGGSGRAGAREEKVWALKTGRKERAENNHLHPLRIEKWGRGGTRSRYVNWGRGRVGGMRCSVRGQRRTKKRIGKRGGKGRGKGSVSFGEKKTQSVFLCGPGRAACYGQTGKGGSGGGGSSGLRYTERGLMAV